MSPRYTRPVSRGRSFDEVRHHYARSVREELERGNGDITAVTCEPSRPALGASSFIPIVCITCLICRTCWLCLCIQLCICLSCIELAASKGKQQS